MLKIFKYPIRSNFVSLPKGARILSLQLQDNIATIWAMVNPNELTFQNRAVHEYATGEDCGGVFHEDYLGTLQFKSGLVFHYFIERK